MKDQEIEILALEMYPVNFDAYWAYDRNASKRAAFIEGAKAIRDNVKHQIDKEPSAFFRANILRHLNNEQMMSLRDWLNTYDHRNESIDDEFDICG